MKIYLNDLSRIQDLKMYPVDIEKYQIEDNIFLRRIENVHGDISFYYDANDELRISYKLKGIMICPCAITLQDVEVPFDLNEDERIVHEEDEDGFMLNESIEVEDLAVHIIIPEAPIKVVKKEKIEYSRGDGWSFVSEEDYEASKKDEIDPRLEKLREYKFEEED